RLALQRRPERALVGCLEVGDELTSPGAQRHPSIVVGVAVLGRPVGQAGGLWCAIGDEMAPVAHHLVGQYLLRGIQRLRSAHAEQVPPLQSMAGGERKRRVSQELGRRRVWIVELVGVYRRITAQ